MMPATNRSEIDTPASTPYSTIGMLGGMIGPMTALEATSEAENAGS